MTAIPLEDRKFYKYNGEVYEFDYEGTQDHLITDEYEKMTVEEVDRHINPEKYMSEEELTLLHRAMLVDLEKRQFVLEMYDQNLYEEFELALKNDKRLEIEFSSLSYIKRMSSFTDKVRDLMGLSDVWIDNFWQEALSVNP